MFSLTEEERNYYIDDLSEGCFCFSNSKLVNYLMPYVRERFPEAIAVELDGFQYICVNEQKRAQVKELMEPVLLRYQEKVIALSETLMKL